MLEAKDVKQTFEKGLSMTFNKCHFTAIIVSVDLFNYKIGIT